MNENTHPRTAWSRALFRLSFYISIGIVAFFVITEHRAHLFGILPYLLLLSCPLMHLFMHGHHDESREREEYRSAAGRERR